MDDQTPAMSGIKHRMAASRERWSKEDYFDRIGSGLYGGTASAHRRGEFAQQRVGLGPVYAAIRDALSVDKRLTGDEPLRAGDKIAFDHDADDVAIAVRNLAGDVMTNDGLAGMVLVAVGVAAIDHDARLDAGFLHRRDGFGYAVGGVVDLVAATSQDDVRVGVPLGDEDGRLAVLGVAEEGVRMRSGQDGIDGNLHVT